MNPTVTTEASPSNRATAAGADAVDFPALWAEARLVYPLYAALVTQFELGPLPYPPDGHPPARPTRAIFNHDLEWLAEVDRKLFAYQIRQLPPELLNASEASLRAFIQRHLRKSDKASVDRDKIDFLLVQYFVLCMPEQLYRQEIQFADVARVLKSVLGDGEAQPPAWCKPLEAILETLKNCESLRDLMENGLLEQGRLIKESAGPGFCEPAALVATCHFNFSLRRAFIRLLHEDLKCVRKAIDTLEENGSKTVDCRRAGFSAAETTAHLRRFCESWKQPFQRDYTESSVNAAFEQILALRADLEEALRLGRVDQQRTEGSTYAAVQPAESTATIRSAEESIPSQVVAGINAADPYRDTSKNLPTPSLTTQNDQLIERIRKQLAASLGSNGKAMSTIVLQDTKVLLSSWEVESFSNEEQNDAADVRRAVLARVLLAIAMDQRKRSGDGTSLDSALALASRELPYFHARAEQAKNSQNLEAAINLGISIRRLLSSIEQAEALRP